VRQQVVIQITHTLWSHFPQDEELVRTLAVTPDEAAATMGAYVLPMYPPHTASCHPLTTSPKVLRDAEQVGWQTVSALLGLDPVLLGMGLQGGHQSVMQAGSTTPGTTAGAPAGMPRNSVAAGGYTSLKDSGASKGSGRLGPAAAKGSSSVLTSGSAVSNLWQRTAGMQLPPLLSPLFSRGGSKQRQP
jgi:hypothetical protein